MQTYSGPIYDGDTHVYEQADAWSRHLPEKYRKTLEVRHVVEGDKYPLYVGPWKIPPGEDAMRLIDGKVKIPAPGMLHVWLKRLHEGGGEMDWVDMPREAIHRDARIAWMDKHQVEACTMFPGEMNTVPAFVEDRVGLLALISSYNRWLNEEWGLNYRDRIYSTGILTFEDKDWAKQEIAWMLKNGVRTIALPPGPFQNRSPADPYFDELWAPLNEAGVVVQYHIGEAKYMHTLQELWGDVQASKSRVGQTAWMWLNAYGESVMWHVLSSYLYLNFFKRYPNIHMISSENGAEFVPYFLRRLDKMRGMARKGYWPCGQLDERPSKIFMRHVKVVAFPEDDLRSLIEQTGNSDWLMSGSDYPHTEGVPTPAEFLRDQKAQFSDAELRKIMFENGRSILGPRH
jgi:predicted TIM-barrel fold metal-dependent hydrolase